MPLFQYRALQSDGTIAEGRLEANGRLEAFRQLEGRGLKPVGLSEENQSRPELVTGFRLPRWKRKKIAFGEREAFIRLLASLLSAGVPLSRALSILCREAASPAARQKWKEIHGLVIDGASLADAMAQSPETFPSVDVAMTRAGETGGFLDVVLDQIAAFQEREKEMRSRVLAALIYPSVLMTMAVVVLIFLLTFFIPRFQSVFEGFGGTLPLMTRIVMGVSRLATQYRIYTILGILILMVLIRNWLKTDKGKREWEQLVLRMPILGTLTARFAMARFCRMLGTLIGAGVPLINALTVSRSSIGNRILYEAVTRAMERVRQGDGLAVSLSDCPALFPGSVLEMISVGEEAGRLDQELVRLAAVTESELDRRLRAAVSLVEPVMLFVMAAFVGTVIASVILPIYTIQDYIR